MERRVDYDTIADGYDDRYRSEIWSGIEAALLAFAGAPPARSVLEVGCGTGHWLELLAQSGARVHGLDASREMLAAARRRLSPNVPLIHGRAEWLPWSDASFDRVICVNAIHHFDDKVAFVREMRRVLRSGGAAMIIGLDPHSGEDRWWIYRYFERTLELDRARCPSTAELRELMQAAGFVECRTGVAQRVPLRPSIDEAIAAGLTKKDSTSQLTILDDDEFARGIAKLERDADEARARGETLMLDSDLTFYATVGSAP